MSLCVAMYNFYVTRRASMSTVIIVTAEIAFLENRGIFRNLMMVYELNSRVVPSLLY